MKRNGDVLNNLGHRADGCIAIRAMHNTPSQIPTRIEKSAIHNSHVARTCLVIGSVHEHRRVNIHKS